MGGRGDHNRNSSEHSAQFFRAVQRNELQELKAIVTKLRLENPLGAINVNTLRHEKSGDTALHICAKNGFIDMIRYLVEEECADLEQINLDGKTALHDAAQFSQPKIVSYLLEKGANVNVVKRADWTPLMLACTKQDVEVIETLLKHGADLRFVNKDGWNCIHIASREGNVNILSNLLNSCTDETAKFALKERKSRNGRKPIHTAVMHGHLEIVKQLAEGISVHQINEEDNCGTTPLMEACRFGFKDIVSYLADVLHVVPLPNKHGVGLLHVAAESNQGEMIEYLVDKFQMDVNTRSSLLGLTPLHWASKEGSLSAVEALLRLGASIDLKDDKGRTAVDMAKEFRKHDVSTYFNSCSKAGTGKC